MCSGEDSPKIGGWNDINWVPNDPCYAKANLFIVGSENAPLT